MIYCFRCLVDAEAVLDRVFKVVWITGMMILTAYADQFYDCSFGMFFAMWEWLDPRFSGLEANLGKLG